MNLIFQSTFNPIGAYLQKRINPKYIMLVATTLMILSIFLSTIFEEWWVFTAFYCIGFPMGLGLIFFSTFMCGTEWFPEHRGLVSGIMIGGMMSGTLVFGFLTTDIANPDNLETVETMHGDGTSEKLYP